MRYLRLSAWTQAAVIGICACASCGQEDGQAGGTAGADSGIDSDAAQTTKDAGDSSASQGGSGGAGGGAAGSGGPAGAGGSDSGVAGTGGAAGTAACLDLDQDGVCQGVDCDDLNPDIPSAEEVCGNGIDDNCEGKADEGGAEKAAKRYVDKDSLGGPCADTNPGTESAPWCTIKKANQTLAAGETVFLRAGLYNETIAPINSGTAEGQRITYVNYPNEKVTLQGSNYGLRLESLAYVTVLGLEILDCTGVSLFISSSNHINIGYCTFDNASAPGSNWAGGRIREGSTYNRIHNCTFSHWGKESGSSPNWDDSGCILDIGSDEKVDASHHNLIVNNTFSYGGHHILGVYSSYNVVRGNTFHNENWYDCHRPETNGKCGNRNVILNSSFPAENIRNVLEDNVIAFSGVPPDNASSSGLSLRTRYNIVRRNVVYHNDSSGISLSADGGNGNDASNNYLYNNVLFHNGYTQVEDWGPTKSGMLLARWVDDAQHNALRGVALKNNIIFDSQLDAVYYYYVDKAEQVVEANYEEDPQFVALAASPTPQNMSAMDFHLQPTSPCLDKGVFLTRTTAAGNGVMIPVESAGYFSDGRGVVAGDLVQFEGQTNTARVTAVDYATNSLTVDKPLSWTAGAGLGLPYFGSRPDQGAFEHGP